jgi:hypothetical protein
MGKPLKSSSIYRALRYSGADIRGFNPSTPLPQPRSPSKYMSFSSPNIGLVMAEVMCQNEFCSYWGT